MPGHNNKCDAWGRGRSCEEGNNLTSLETGVGLIRRLAYATEMRVTLGGDYVLLL